jgi:hypothetical protein
MKRAGEGGGEAKGPEALVRRERGEEREHGGSKITESCSYLYG